MAIKQTVHEPEAMLADAQDAIEDANRFLELLELNEQETEREVELRVPFTVIMEAVNQLDLEEVHLLTQRLEERLEILQP
jgi:hypothetical protein